MKWLLNKGERLLTFILVDVFDIIWSLEILAVIWLISGVCIILFELLMLIFARRKSIDFYYYYYKKLMGLKDNLNHIIGDKNVYASYLIAGPTVNYCLKRVGGMIVRRQTIG